MFNKRPGSKHETDSGFTLVETLVAMAIMAIGLLGAAALMSQMSVSSNDSRYMSIEALLASEKLEDLNHYPPGDDHIAVPGGGTAGSLTADLTAAVGTTPAVDYFDNVQISSGNGAIVETTTGTNAAGVLTYTTTTHSPDGSVLTPPPATVAPAPTADMLLFRRRWIIEKDVPVPNVLRVTVLVQLLNGTRAQTATFQTSMVRPGPQP